MTIDVLMRLAAERLEALRLPYFVTGSYASSIYGEPRSTADVDIVVALTEPAIPAFCAAFPEPEFYLSDDAVRDAVRRCSMFNAIHTESVYKIDFMVANDSGLNECRFDRRRRLTTKQGFSTYFASPEDVIVSKLLFYGEGRSDKHLRDIAGILRIQADRLDRAYIDRWASRLGVAEIWEAVQTRERAAPGDEQT